MRDANQTAAWKRGRSDASWVRLAATVLTCVLAVAFLAVAGLRILHPESLSPARAATTRAADRDDDITAAARRVTLAFLDVDYRDMAPRVDKVLALATGTFKSQYQQTSVNLTAAAREGRAVSSGSIKYVGITDVDDNGAVVHVAADSTVSNLAMEKARKKGQKVDDKRYYRFQLHLTKVGDRWLLSKLDFVQ